MKKILYLSICAILFANLSFGQVSNVFTILSQTESKMVIKVSAMAPSYTAVQTPNGTQYILKTKGGTSILKKGFPDLPKLSTSIIAPFGKKWIVSSTSTDGIQIINNKPLSPSKGNVYRTVNIDDVPYEYAPDYNSNTTFPSTIAKVNSIYSLRDFDAQTLVVYPFNYNFSNQNITYYTEIIITLKTINSTTQNARVNSPIVSEFDKVYSQHFLNYNNAKQTRYTPLEEDGDMLIICYDNFMTAMAPFVAWKKEKGIRTEMVSYSSVGSNSAAIKTYVQNYFTTHPNFTYLMLIGDATQVPASQTSNGDSDNDYGYLIGSDSYQEIFVGRISATTDTEVTSQINKAIDYEKNPSLGANANWYKHALAIASTEGAGIGDDNEIDWEHQRNIGTQLLSYNYDNVYELYDGSQGGNDAAGDPIAQDVINVFNNNGIGVWNYTGHGNVTLVATSGFSNTNVASLTNTKAQPFVWIVGCQVGNFVSSTCLAEKLARATFNGVGSGAVASMMSTINQSWAPPMEGQDAMNAILSENAGANIKRTFGGISINGCFQMNDAYGTQGDEMTDTWTLFGDPSMVVRTDIPELMTVTHVNTVPLGATSLQVNCNTEGATVCLTINGEILSVATVTGGVANFTFTALTTPDSIHVCATAYNTVPYFSDIQIIAANGPYVVTNTYNVNDVVGNNNGLADYNENLNLELTLENLGTQDANILTGVLTTTDSYITITDGNEVFGNLTAGNLTSLTNAFAFTVADGIPDQHVAAFNLNLTDDNGDTWNNTINVILNAPSLTVLSYSIDDATGNNNGALDPGETVVINLLTKNIGHSATTNAIATLTSANTDITINNGVSNQNSVAVNATNTTSYTVVVSASATLYSFVDFEYLFDANYYDASNSINTKIGLASEDFETNSFNQFNWLQSGNSNWFTTSSQFYDGAYSSQSGAIGNSQSTTLSIDVSSAVNDNISFARKVSSEDGYDFLKFYNGTAVLGSWSGEQAWAVETYSVGAGTHTFKWTYSKDTYAAAGADAAWVDDITLPLNSLTTINELENNVSDLIISPNPASDIVNIKYLLANQALVNVDLYNVLGQKIMTLIDNETQSASSHTLSLNAESLPNGNYFIRFMINGNSYTRKMVVNR